LLREVTQEVKGRSPGPERKPRILVYGSIMDFDAFIKLIEDSGAHVVVDDVCIGTRVYAHDVPDTPDPFDGLVKCYLEDFVCPRTGRGWDNARFDYIKEYIRDFKVNGVVFYALNFCDPHKFDIPSLKDYLAQDGIPILYIEDDYTLANLEAIKTRVQAFVEMLG
jgi:benzoyl-CoA reductase/2-hydroxyglutaryl-CoA dehydratase subunit BcrC/BadD/HgdB